MYIDFFGTQGFHNHFSNSESKLQDAKEWFENTGWDQVTNMVSQDVIVSDVPDVRPSPTGDDLLQRAAEADNYLSYNYGAYDSADGIMVLEYNNTDNYDYVGQTVESCSAGKSAGKLGMVDFAQDRSNFLENSNVPAYYNTIAHEMGHVFCAKHTDATVYDNGEASIMLNTWYNDQYCGSQSVSEPSSARPEFTDCALASDAIGKGADQSL